MFPKYKIDNLQVHNASIHKPRLACRQAFFHCQTTMFNKKALLYEEKYEMWIGDSPRQWWYSDTKKSWWHRQDVLCKNVMSEPLKDKQK